MGVGGSGVRPVRLAYSDNADNDKVNLLPSLH